MLALTQTSLCCGCGAPETGRGGLCRRCARRARLSIERFGGMRELVLKRDSYQCQTCGGFEDVLVHHRRPGVLDCGPGALITLCRACHLLVHLTARPSFRFFCSIKLYALWSELHRGPVQCVLPLAPGGGDPVEQAALDLA